MKDFKLYLIIASLLLVGYIFIQYNKPQPVNWQPTLSREDKIPFGTCILYQQLSNIFPAAQVTDNDQSIYSTFSKPVPAGNYIIIANDIKIGSYDYRQLTKYIEAGNTVFISAFNWTGIFNTRLNVKVEIEDNKNNTALSFTNDKFKDHGPYDFDKEVSNHYFSQFDTVHATVISKNKAGNATYLSYKIGKGTLLLCANPKLFSNYSLLTADGANYAERALSYLPASKNIFWDEYQNHDIEINTSPMRVFLSNPSLQWSYYLSLFTLMVYVLFEVKRRQRIIPIIEPLKNSTIDFVSVVGRVYFEKRDNANIAYKKIQYLLSHLREVYALKTNKLNNEFIENLTNKTGLDHAFVSELIDFINYLAQQPKVTDNELIELNQLIEKFYAKS